nr:FAD binding domain-containing protein [Anaerolineae bacterium]
MLYNLREYHRAQSMSEALNLIRRKDITTVPLYGGTQVVGSGNSQIEAVVDLADLGLDTIKHERQRLVIGSMVTLQTLVEHDSLPDLIRETTRRTTTWNLRNQETLGGVLAADLTRSPLAVMLAAFGALLELADKEGQFLLEDFSPSLLNGDFITTLSFPLPDKYGSAYEQVGRTPADAPIVNAAAVVNLQEARVAVGGLLAGRIKVIEAPPPGAARIDTDGEIPIDDYLGSKDYRAVAAGVLVKRVLIAAASRVEG